MRTKRVDRDNSMCYNSIELKKICIRFGKAVLVIQQCSRGASPVRKSFTILPSRLVPVLRRSYSPKIYEDMPHLRDSKLGSRESLPILWWTVHRGRACMDLFIFKWWLLYHATWFHCQGWGYILLRYRLNRQQQELRPGPQLLWRPDTKRSGG